MIHPNESGLTAVLDIKTLSLVGGALALFYFLVTTIVQWYRLSHIPGPWLASLTYWWIYPAVKGKDFHRTVLELQGNYGKVVRISPTGVMLADPETFWRINSARSSYPRDDWYDAMSFNPYGRSVLCELDSVKHDKRKAKLVHGFSGKGLKDLEANLDTQLDALLKHLKRKTSAHHGQAVVNIGLILQYFQVDLITAVGLGKAWGNLQHDQDSHNYLQDSEKTVAFIHAISFVPLVRTIFFSPLFLRLLGPDISSGWLGLLRQEVDKRVEQKKLGKNDGSSMLDEWLKRNLSPSEAEIDLSLLLPAGTETSITAIRATMLFLMTSPSIYQKLKQEIADGIKQGSISSPIKHEEAKQLPYLQGVINEGLRCGCPVTAGFPKAVPPGGDVICGTKLPGGTEVHCNLLAMMRDQEVFGDDVGVFRPERFIDCDDATKATRKKVVDLIFGHGRWLCLGKPLVGIEMGKVFVELLRSFDFQVADPERPWVRESTLTYYIDEFHARVIDNPISVGISGTGNGISG